jgi:hypothetical protein
MLYDQLAVLPSLVVSSTVCKGDDLLTLDIKVGRRRDMTKQEDGLVRRARHGLIPVSAELDLRLGATMMSNVR